MLRVMNLNCEGDNSHAMLYSHGILSVRTLNVTSLGATLQISTVHCDLTELFSAICQNSTLSISMLTQRRV